MKPSRKQPSIPPHEDSSVKASIPSLRKRRPRLAQPERMAVVIRHRRRVSQEQKLLLEAVLDYGLSLLLAGRLLSLTSTSRIARRVKAEQALFERRLINLSPAERRQRFQERNELKKSVAIKALILVCQAREQGLIKKSNQRKLDKSIDIAVNNDLKRMKLLQQETLLEKMQHTSGD